MYLFALLHVANLILNLTFNCLIVRISRSLSDQVVGIGVQRLSDESNKPFLSKALVIGEVRVFL